jgi:hypothetical protein
MGFPGYRRSLRTSVAFLGMAAAGASALVGLQGSFAAAAVADAITVTPASGTAITVDEGNLVDGQLVAKFTDSGNTGGNTKCDEQYLATINWGDGSTSTASSTGGTISWEISEVPTGVFDVFGSHTYADSGPYNISVSVVDNSEDAESSGAAVNTDTAAVGDASLARHGNNSNRGFYTAVEGQSITVAADFQDQRPFEKGANRDAGITGTIDWGDGTALQTVPASAPSSDICDCSGPQYFEITASHVYDAAIPASAVYQIVVTALDDGGTSATTDLQAMISDGALTAGSDLKIATAATSTFSVLVGSFTDDAGAQAAVSDFVATIDWGDNTTSTGTVTQTGSGAFNVDGSHAYATTGTKNITATVTDEEGSTVTLKETATVGAAPVAPVAPVVLPATGQPHQPSQPALPLIPLALLALGLVGLATGGRILAKTRR